MWLQHLQLFFVIVLVGGITHWICKYANTLWELVLIISLLRVNMYIGAFKTLLFAIHTYIHMYIFFLKEKHVFCKTCNTKNHKSYFKHILTLYELKGSTFYVWHCKKIASVDNEIMIWLVRPITVINRSPCMYVYQSIKLIPYKLFFHFRNI